MTQSSENEILEVWDWETAKPTGRPVRRDLSHREGIPHEGVHLWVIRTSGPEIEVLFQHRAPHKKMHPDCLDITVGGHVPFGLTERKIHKEAMEEIGIIPDDDHMVDLGYFRYEEIDHELIHREFQHVYLLLDNRPLKKYSFTDGEVIGIYAVPLKKLDRLLREDRSFVITGYNGTHVVSKEVSRRDFHPLLFSPIMKDYMQVVLQAGREFASGREITAHMGIKFNGADTV